MFNFSGGLTSARFCLRRWSTSSLSQAFPKCSMSRQAKNRCPGPWGRSMAPSASSTCQQALSTTSGNIVRLTPTFLPYISWNIHFRKIKSILLQSVQIKWHCVNCWSPHIECIRRISIQWNNDRGCIEPRMQATSLLELKIKFMYIFFLHSSLLLL